MDFELITIGTGAALPARGRSPSAQLLQLGGQGYLIDCGEGTQQRMRSLGINFQRITDIFISHLHGDHYLGLLGLMSTMHLLGRQKPLTVHGPMELKEIIDLQLKASNTYLRYPFTFRALLGSSGTVIHADGHIEVTALRLAHRIPCTGFVFRELGMLRKLDQSKMHLVPHYHRKSIQMGEDLVLQDGQVIPNRELTLGAPHQRSYAYMSDTAYQPELLEFIQEVDLLYHEATFTEQLRARAKETYHSTARQAATMARDARVGHLLLGHFSSRYKDLVVLLDEARQVFVNTSLANEGGRCRIERTGSVDIGPAEWNT